MALSGEAGGMTTPPRPHLHLEDIQRANAMHHYQMPSSATASPFAARSPSLHALNEKMYGTSDKLPSLTPDVLSGNAVEIRRTAKALGRALMKLEHPQSVMIVAKVVDVKIIEFTRVLACHLIDTPRACGISGLKVYIDAKLKNHPAFNYARLVTIHPHYAEQMDWWHSEMCRSKPESIDFIITLGGDGTVLLASYLFQKSQVPPVIPFHLGSLGFLTNFNIADIREVLERVIGTHGDGVRVNMRMRLKCEVFRQSYPSAPSRGRGGDNERIKALRESHQRLFTPLSRGSTGSLLGLAEAASSTPTTAAEPATNTPNSISPQYGPPPPGIRLRALSSSYIFQAPMHTPRPRSPMPSNSVPVTPPAGHAPVESSHDVDAAEDVSVISEASMDNPVSVSTSPSNRVNIPDILNVLDSITPSLTSYANSLTSSNDWATGSGRRGRGVIGDQPKGEPIYIKSEEIHILNDLVVDRGPSAYMSQLELYVDGRHLTTIQADGLVLSGPTGSTAYSLSAGGSVVHPECPAILVTPICPHTLSFRPLILPDSAEIRIQVPHSSRNTCFAAFDGRHRIELLQGDYICITMSPYPMPTVCAEDQSLDWFESLRRCLHWNERVRQKGSDESPPVGALEDALCGPSVRDRILLDGRRSSVPITSTSYDKSSPQRPYRLEPLLDGAAPSYFMRTSNTLSSTSSGAGIDHLARKGGANGCGSEDEVDEDLGLV
ncbi:NAD+ kinase [Synchytrium endobioticum]|nr:NAD+ kinase [Synchytrium endobioticum]